MATGSKLFDGNLSDFGVFCDGHPEMTLDIICRDHDVVLCSVCASEKHIACVRLEPITNDFINTMKKKDFKHFGKDLSEMKRLLSKLKSKREEDKKKLQEETEVAVKEIEEFRKLIDWVLDRMERKGKEYIQKRYKELNKVVTQEIMKCEEMLAFFEKMKSHWKSSKDLTSVEQFVNMKKGKQMMEKAQKLCDTMKNHKHREIVKFTVDPKVENFARNLSWFGKDRTYLSFEQPLSFPRLYGIKHENQFDIRVKGDKHVCCVVDTCQLQDGTILTADLANRRLKQLDVLYRVVDTCDLPGDPVAVSSVDAENAAAALHNGTDTLIQTIKLGDGLPLGDSFTIAGRCKGLTCSSDAVYVSTGDKICKYTARGELLEEFSTGGTIGNICLTLDYKKVIFIGDHGRLGVMTKSGGVCKEIQIQNLTSENAIAVDSNDQIMIPMPDSHSIVQYNHDLQKQGDIAGPSNGIRNPQSVVYDRISNRLVVAMKFKNVIKVFELK